MKKPNPSAKEIERRWEIVKTIEPWICGVAFSFCHNFGGDQEAVAQMGRLYAMQAAANWKGPGKFLSYCGQILRKRMRGYALMERHAVHIPEYQTRDAGRWGVASLELQHPDGGTAMERLESGTSGASLEARDLYDTAMAMLERKGRKHWKKIIQGLAEGRTLTEIGDEFGITRQAVEQRQKAAMRWLRGMLARP